MFLKYDHMDLRTEPPGRGLANAVGVGALVDWTGGPWVTSLEKQDDVFVFATKVGWGAVLFRKAVFDSEQVSGGASLAVVWLAWPRAW